MGNALLHERRDVASSRLPFRLRAGIVVLSGLAGLAVVLATPRFAQDPAYHRFADRRAVFGIARFGDVVTNVGFVIVGLLGLGHIAGAQRRRPGAAFAEPREAWPYTIFFVGVTLIGFGSAWYHLAPGNDSLLWDRLPMSLAFMALFSAVIVDRISRRAGLRLLPFLLAAGLASVLYWHRTESVGAGDQRFYLFVQFYPMVAIVLMMFLFPPRYTHSAYLWGTLGLYAAAKAAEHLDRPILALTRVVSGHSLKHLLAALAILWVLLMLRRREPAPLSSADRMALPRAGPQPGERRY